MSLNLLYPPFSFTHTSKISCSSSSDHQINSRTTSTVIKKRRKPRPSFSEQVLDKWGVKNTSSRQNFPWQEQKKNVNILPVVEKDEEEEEEEEKNEFVGESRIGVVSDSVSFGHGNRIKVAPWVQERKIRNLDGRRDEGKIGNGISGNEERGKDGGNVVSENLKINERVQERKIRNVDGRKDGGYDCEKGKIGNVISGNVVSENVKINERVIMNTNESRNNGGKMRNFEGLSDKFDSENLFLERNFGLKKESLVDKIDNKISHTHKVSRIEEGRSRDFAGLSDTFNSNKIPLGRDIGYKNEGEGRLLEEKEIFREVLKVDDSDSTKVPWEGGMENVDGNKRFMKSNTWEAEKLIPEHELKRLRNVSLRMVERFQVKKAGITQELVDSIHEKWKVDEVVKLKFEGSSAMNMKRTHEHLENRTGGLVIWRSGSSIVLYRGMTYKLQCVNQFNKQIGSDNKVSSSAKATEKGYSGIDEQSKSISSLESPVHNSSRQSKDLSEEELVELNEFNLLLDGLGPRFIDWNGRDPVPVNADLLPSVVRGYKPPFRYLPHGTRHALKDSETTFYRRNARTMPPHFALGRNRELQGLAAAMVKLWEKSAIAKIAIKRGVHNTCNERMAEELKILTGGTLLSRNKEYIVFYRGNDFLPPVVTKTLEEAKEVAALQVDEEDQARQKASLLIDSTRKVAMGPLVAGTLAETLAATSRWGREVSDEHRDKMMRESAVARHASLVRFLEKKLALAKGKITKAEKALGKLQEKLDPSELPTDLETLTDEERFLFRKIGLSMKPFLDLGRRGVFDGTIENMHLHWKYRELVKIFVERKTFAQVKHVAIMLESESGGVLVSIEKTMKGYAIILYRGKNYQPPDKVKPTNLLTRRQALARSIELQRREALKHHVFELKDKLEKLKVELEDMKTIDEIDEATLYSRVDDGSDDDDPDFSEGVEDEEASLEIYDGNEDESTRNEGI